MSKIIRTLKIIVIGDSLVGKTSIISMFTDNNFSHTHIATIGIDYKIKNIYTKNGEKIKLQIWDTAGQERFHTITQTYYQGSHGVILVYDCTSEESFSNLKYWIQQIKLRASKDAVIYIVSNKCDTKEKYVKISSSLGKSFAEENHASFIEVSAAKKYNIDELFLGMVEDIIKKKRRGN